MMDFQNPILTATLIDRVVEGVPARTQGIHGMPHWIRVERNGLSLAQQTGADATIVSLFALFHDSRRFNDDINPGHGARGANLAEKLFREGLLPIDEERLRRLVYAAAHHADEDFSDDVTTGCCWDANRSDLTRLEIDPDPGLLNTLPARTLALAGDYSPLELFAFEAHSGDEREPTA